MTNERAPGKAGAFQRTRLCKNIREWRQTEDDGGSRQ